MADVNRQTEEMLSPDDMMLDSEPVTNEQLVEAGKDLGQFALESTPIVGEAIIAKDIGENISEGDYLSAGLNTAALGVGALPIVGDVLNKPLRAAAKKFRKQDAEVANKMLKDVDSIDTWKNQNPNPKPQKQNPNIEKAANDLLEGNITGKQYRSVVKENMPIIKIQEVPEIPSFTEIVGALNKDKSAKGILGLNKTVKNGTRVASRLDIPAYEKFDKWVVSVHDAYKKGRESLDGDIMGYGKTAILKNVEFKGMSQGAARISSRREDKGTIARIFGDYYNAEPENVAEYAAQAMKDKNWTQVGYNPFRHGFFYDKDTGMPVKSAEEVIQVGPLVLAKNAQKMKISEAKQVSPKGGIRIRAGKPIEGLQNLKETKTVFNEGGMAIEKQMEMFEDGGLMQEGGTTDPVSGNDVPVGSTQEEVRDDIPAQLSEGEFVFPADVVRFYGLEKLMEMRQRAKAGLQMMEDMGQMGNSEEATLPDDIPFDLEDLDMEDGPEYNDTMEMQVGGFVQPQVFTGIQSTQPSAFQNYQPQYVPYQAPTVPTTYQPVQQQAVPTFTGQVPQAEDLLKMPQPGEQDLRKYVNDEGQVRMIPFVNDQPVYPIPQGFYPEAEKPVEEEAPTAVTTETTRVADGGGRDDNVLVGGVTPAQIQKGISEAKDRYAITGSRGIDLLQALPLGNIIKNMFDVQGPTIGTKAPEPMAFGPQQIQRTEYEKVLGTGITGYVGYEKGDLDPVTGGVFNKHGIAVDKDGGQTRGPQGTFSYASVGDFSKAIAAGNKSGWRGGLLSDEAKSNLSSAAAANYSKFEKELEAGQDKPSKPDTSKSFSPSAPTSQEGQSGKTGVSLGRGEDSPGAARGTGQGLDSKGRADI